MSVDGFWASRPADVEARRSRLVRTVAALDGGGVERSRIRENRLLFQGVDAKIAGIGRRGESRSGQWWRVGSAGHLDLALDRTCRHSFW
jgi:hypothetical protein